MIKGLSVFLLVCGLSMQAVSAPCCGGSANNPSFLTGDDRFQVTSAVALSSVLAEAPVGGGLKTRSENDSEQSQVFRIDIASLISDRSQLSVTVPMIHRQRSRGVNEASGTGFGDLTVSASYEVLPDWNYHPWRPKGFLFVGGIVPTGGSVYESSELYAIDARGRGFWGASLGTFLLKSWSSWDVSLLMELHRFFNKERITELGILKISPGWGSQQMLSMGWSPGGGTVRLGVSLARNSESAVATSGVMEGLGAPTVLWTPSFQIGYLVSPDLSLGVSVSDQTLLRSSENTALARSVGFVMQKRWER